MSKCPIHPRLHRPAQALPCNSCNKKITCSDRNTQRKLFGILLIQKRNQIVFTIFRLIWKSIGIFRYSAAYEYFVFSMKKILSPQPRSSAVMRRLQHGALPTSGSLQGRRRDGPLRLLSSVSEGVSIVS